MMPYKNLSVLKRTIFLVWRIWKKKSKEYFSTFV